MYKNCCVITYSLIHTVNTSNGTKYIISGNCPVIDDLQYNLPLYGHIHNIAIKLSHGTGNQYFIKLSLTLHALIESIKGVL